ncbi:MAG: LytR/AlgR family response regulator transcription factor [Xanthomarina gelatinilytica]|uniref:LytR/AlgR family response regulator transcription factor n=1 Tax=Xanthomarina gelatinilytica TaxID=1137281 RepID=UPI003A8B6C5C
MNLNCIIVDDELTPRKILKQYIDDVSGLNLIGEFWNPIEAIGFIDSNKIDIVFLDIEMPRISGMDFAKILNGRYNIIFTTAHREFALEGFDLNAVDYLLKPFSFQRFIQAVSRCVSNGSALSDNSSHIFLKANKKMIRIDFDKLLYIEGMSNYIKINLLESSLTIYEKLSVIIDKLPQDKFTRIHNSFIINLSKIESYTKEFVIINNKHIPVSKTYRNTFLQCVEN